MSEDKEQQPTPEQLKREDAQARQQMQDDVPCTICGGRGCWCKYFKNDD